MKKTVFITTSAILAAMIGFALYRYVPTIRGLLPGARGVQIETVKAGDAGTVEIHLTKEHRALVLLVPDRRMSRQWNTPNLESQVGLRLSRILNERGVDTAVYDRMDAGFLPERFADPAQIEAQVADAFSAVQKYHDSQPSMAGAPIHVIAHGDGCLAALSAISAHRLEVDRLLLFGCAYDSTLLQAYGELILNTMRLNGVSDRHREEGRKEWKEWASRKEHEVIPEAEWIKRQKKMLEEGVNADTVALRKTLAIFQRPENQAWLKAAAHTSYRELVEGTLKRTKVTIEQYPSAFDEEVPESLVEANRQTAASFGPRFIFRVLPQTDHFLFERTSPPASPVENMMSRSNPFKDFSPAFLAVLDEHWL